MALHRNPHDRFEHRLRSVTAAGPALPDELVALRQRAKDFRPGTGRPMSDRLARAIIDNDPDADLKLLYALALAEANTTPPLQREVTEYVRTKVNATVRELYAAHAIDHYGAIAALFDTAADAFTAAATTIDPETPAEHVVTATEKVRRAWADAETHAHTMTTLLPALRSAAALAGLTEDDDPDTLLPLTVDTTGMHRRQAWVAWDTDDRETTAQRTAERAPDPFTRPEIASTRTRRWGALVALGAVLRAHPAAEPFTPYRRPRPMVERVEQGPGGPRRFMVDPEDEPTIAEPANA